MPRFRSDDSLLVLLVGAIIVVAVLAASRAAWSLAAGAVGFLLLTLGWIGMHLRLRLELPDHPLSRMSYVVGRGRTRRRAFFDPVALHWQRHQFDVWAALLAIGVLLILGSSPGQRCLDEPTGLGRSWASNDSSRFCSGPLPIVFGMTSGGMGAGKPYDGVS